MISQYIMIQTLNSLLHLQVWSRLGPKQTLQSILSDKEKRMKEGIMQTKHEQNTKRREASDLYAKVEKNIQSSPLKLASLRFKKETK